MSEEIRKFKEEHLRLFEEKVGAGEWVKLPILNDKEDAKLMEFSRLCAKAKSSERHHITDSQKEIERIYNGKYGEWAFRKHIGLPPPDIAIGDSYIFRGADLIIHGCEFGIKASKAGQSALIFKRPKTPEIILVREPQNPKSYYLCGVASKTVMAENHDDSLSIIANNPNKAGLTIEGYKNLRPFEAIYKYIKYKDKNTKTTGLTCEETCEMFIALAESDEFMTVCEGYKLTKILYER